MKIDFQPDKSLLVYTIQGKINLEDLTRLRELQASIQKNGGVKILTIVEKFDGYTSFAAAKEAVRLDLGWIGKADKYAMLSDSPWLKRVVNGLGIFVPGITFKTLHLEQREKAIAWLLGAQG